MSIQAQLIIDYVNIGRVDEKKVLEVIKDSKFC